MIYLKITRLKIYLPFLFMHNLAKSSAILLLLLMSQVLSDQSEWIEVHLLEEPLEPLSLT